jgi:hypothetical protein
VDLPRERGVPAPQLEVEAARLEQVRAAQDDLVHVERLRQEVLRARCQRPRSDGPVDVPGQEHDRQPPVAGLPLVDRLERREAVKVRHVDIEEHEVRLLRTDGLDGGARVGEAGDATERRALDDPDEEENVEWLVIDDDDARLERFDGRGDVLLDAGHALPEGRTRNRVQC